MAKYKLKEIRKNLDDLNRPLASKLFSHPFSIVFVYLLANFTAVSPNLITIISFILRISSAVCFFSNDIIAGVIFAYVAHVLDSSDGVLARTIGKTSKFGAALDPMLDRVGYSALFVVLVYKLYLFGMMGQAILIGIMFFMYFNELSLLEICSAYKEEGRFVKKTKLKSRISQFKALFSFPVFGKLFKNYVIFMAKIKINPIPSLIESYFLIFIIAPLFGFNYWIILAGLLAYIPQLLFSLLRAVTTVKKLK